MSTVATAVSEWRSAARNVGALLHITARNRFSTSRHAATPTLADERMRRSEVPGERPAPAITQPRFKEATYGRR
jgi:hypothetical protein